MDGMLTLASREPVTPGDHWIEVFQQRGVWHLTRDIVERWVARNSIFFGMLARLVPHGSHVLELGCGPGRHALGAAMLGYRVLGIDLFRTRLATATREKLREEVVVLEWPGRNLRVLRRTLNSQPNP